VLEIGFGHGRTIERLAGLIGDGHVTGVDVSDAMLAMALRRNGRGVAAGRIDLSVADCAALPFDAASFDGALSVHTLYFWSEPVSRLREIRRVLRPDGRFVLGFTRAESDVSASFPCEVYSFYREGEVTAMLAEAGFEPAEFTRVGEASLGLARAAPGSA
jgi:ubiquinone/menaquinone biosynthesis C-methylase UbiE